MRWVIDATHHKFKMGLGISCGLMPRLQAAAAPIRHSVARCRTGRLRGRVAAASGNRRKMLIPLTKTAEMGFGCLAKAECDRWPVD
ncbi:hypothetical protein EOA86_10685 [Mesorhizobium sp. M5C.F.Ca.IN.020.32.2.1]|nr:hypothetical protein EOA86_10685 [Mesorhizobium sp. M5C.F.Ca.IN.020.32.2.1]